jgi:glycosyltransferase involved in cell wall biosynthesis
VSGLRVVVVMVEPPVPFGNAAARWFYVLLKGLVERGHRVTAFAACSKPDEMARAAALFPAPLYDLRCYPHPRRRGLRAKWETWRRPCSYLFSAELCRALEAELARGFDVLHLEQLWSGWLGLCHRDRALLNVHFLAGMDLEHAPISTWRERLARSLIRTAEARLVRRFTHFRTLSPRLASALLRVNPRARVRTVPLALDTGLYGYVPPGSPPAAPVVSVIGNMDWYPTRSAAERFLTRLWPGIKARAPEARALVVGWNARVALKNFLNLPDVTVEENVPDIHPYFERTAVLLYAPASGSGMKVKVLEALAFGVPVVTTSEGVEGLPAEDGVHAGVSEDDGGLIERTVRLLCDVRARERQRAAGRVLLEAHCGARPALDAVETIYREIAGQSAGGRR